MDNIKTWLTNNRLLTILLASFVLIASTYSIVTPLFEMSDEFWHYPMVKTLADGNGLPVQDPDNHGPWKQEGSQPPLYYYIGAAATFWIDTSDVNTVRRPNPHVDNGIITEDGNINLVTHNTKLETWPWRGTTLAVHIVRLLSVLMSTAAVYFTYRIGQEVFPEKPWLALSGAAAVAFTPMFAFISGAINNDNLAVFIAAIGLWLMLLIIREANQNQPTLNKAILLGIVIGLGALTKTSTLGMFGLAGLTMAYAAWKQKRWQSFFIEGPVIIAIAAVIAGWWYWRNWKLYGDPFGLNVFIEILGRRAHEASLRQLWGERFGFMQSYWGLFGGVNVPMSDWTYTVLNWLAVLSVIGVVITLVLKASRDEIDLSSWMPTILSLLWIVVVVGLLAFSWARVTWSSQGRLVFSAIMAINLWFIAGLGGWLPEQWGKIVTGCVTAFMATLTIIAPFVWIAPSYKLPEQTSPPSNKVSYDFTPPGAREPAMRLLGYELDTAKTEPGAKVRLILYWESLTPMERDWSTFIHLRDSAGFLAGQRDTYPGLGLIATSDIVPGRRWVDSYVVTVSESAYAPEEFEVLVGLYDYNTCPACERMTLSDGKDAVSLGQIRLLSRAYTDIPNTVSLNFGDELELIGYSLDTRIAHPEDTISLTLYWRGLHLMENNYTVSVQVLGTGTSIYGQVDTWPHDGDLPTTAWTPDEIVVDTYYLTILPDTPSAEYNIQIVVYWMDEVGNIKRLQRITDDRRLVDDFVLLTQIRVTE